MAKSSGRHRRGDERSAAGYARYVGRVGALAVALGIGVAVGTTPGGALADPKAPDSTAPNPSAEPPKPTDPAPPPKTPDTPAEEKPDPLPTNTSQTSVPVGGPSAPQVTVSGSGGQNTTINGESTGEPKLAEPPAPGISGPNSKHEPKKQADKASELPAKQRQPEPAPERPKAKITEIASTPTESTKSTPLALTLAEAPVTKVAAPVVVEPVALQAPQPPKPATSTVDVAASVLNVLSPLGVPTPGTPTTPVASLALLAFTRRELGDTTSKATPMPASLTTSQPVQTTPSTMSLLAASAPTTAAAPVAAAAEPPPPSPGVVGTVGITVGFVVNSVVNTVYGLLGALFGLLGGNQAPTTSPIVDSIDPVTGVVTGRLRATDPNGDPITYSVTTAPPASTGAFSVTNTGTFTFTPTAAARHQAAATAQDPDTAAFAITVSDNRGGATSVAFNLPITPVNRNPTLVSKTVSAPNASGAVTVTVVASDPDGDALTYTAPATTANGTITNNGGGSFTYTPTTTAQHNATAGGPITDDFTVTVTDGHTGSLAVPITTTIKQSNQNPTLVSKTVSAPNASGAVTITVVASDPDGDALTYTAPATTANGTITNNGGGSFTYTPTTTAQHNATAGGPITDDFTVTVTDGHTGSLAVPITATIAPTNQNPTLVFKSATAPDAAGLVNVTVVANDPDGDALTYTAPPSTANGIITNNGGGTFTYTPTTTAQHNATAGGPITDDFTVTVTDGHGGTLAVPITALIKPVNQIPTLVSKTVGAPDPTSGAVAITVVATDPDGDAVNYTAPLSTANGTITINGNGSFTYTPTDQARGDANGTAGPDFDNFTVTVTDGHTGSLAVPITTTIAPANRAPINGDADVAAPDAAGLVSVTVTATDPDGDTLTYTAPPNTIFGTITKNGNGTFTYDPTDAAQHAAAAAAGPVSDSFTVTVSDGRGGTLAVPVSVTIKPANQDPIDPNADVGQPNSNTGAVIISVTATDPDHDTLTFTASAPTNGAIINNGGGTFTYTPSDQARGAANGTEGPDFDHFTITISDGHGGTLDVPITVTIAPGNRAPTLVTMTVNDPDEVTGLVSGSVTATDPDGDSLTYSGSTITGKGTFTVNPSTGNFTYQPTAAAQHAGAAGGDAATDSFTLSVSDGHGGTLDVPVTVAVNPTNQDPTLVSTTVGNPTGNNAVVTVTVVADDPDEDQLSYAVANPPAHGTIVVAADGTFSYTPSVQARVAANNTQQIDYDSFSVAVTDGHGGTLTVQVNNVEIAPLEIATIPSADGKRPQWIVFNDDGSLAYVANENANSVSVFNTQTLELVDEFDVGTAPVFVAKAPDGKIWVTNRDSDNFSVIDPDTHTVVQPQVTLGDEPIGIAFGPNNVAYIASRAAFGSHSGSIAVIDTTDYHVITTVPIDSPVMLAVSPDQTKLYVANQYAGNVLVLDTSDYHLIAPVDMGGPGAYPTMISFNDDGSRAYVTNQFTNEVRVIDTTTETVIAAIFVGNNHTPVGIAINADGSRAYVSNFSGLGHDQVVQGTVSVIDLDSNTVVAEIPVGAGPIGVTLNPAGSQLWIANSDGTISIIPIAPPRIEGTVAGTFAAGSSFPTGIVYSPDGDDVYLTSLGASTVTVIDTSTNTPVGQPIIVGQSPAEAAVSPNGAFVYVVNQSDGTVSVIDTNTRAVIGAVNVGDGNIAWDVVFHPDEPYAYALSRFGGVKVIDTSTHTVVDTIGVNSPYRMAISPDGAKIYVTHLGTGGVTIIDTASRTNVGLVNNINGGVNVDSVAFNPVSNRAYVTAPGSGRIYVIDTDSDTLIGSVELLNGSTPSALAVSPDGTRVYTVNSNTDTISVIDASTNALVDTIRVGDYPNAIAISPDGTKAYITHYTADGMVTVLDLTPTPSPL